MSGVLGPALAAALVVLIVGSIFVERWLMGEHSAGRMSGRKAGWLYGGTIAAPWILIVMYVAFRDIGGALIVALGMLAMAPALIIPWVAIFRYPDDTPQSKRYPPR